jgi:hypothetical protein
MEEQKIKEYIFQAVQSGKQETSGLVDMVIHKMENRLDISVDKAVAKYTNGKLDKLENKIDNYIKGDNEWKEKYGPYLESIVGISVGGKILVRFILGIASVGGAILLIYRWFK